MKLLGLKETKQIWGGYSKPQMEYMKLNAHNIKITSCEDPEVRVEGFGVSIVCKSYRDVSIMAKYDEDIIAEEADIKEGNLYTPRV